MNQLLKQAPWANKAGLNAEAISLLALDFAWLHAPDRVLCFLLDGDEEAVLLELGGLSDGTQQLRLRACVDFWGNDPRRVHRSQFFLVAECDDAKFWRRLGAVYEAASRGDRPALSKVLGSSAPPWLEILLCEALQITHFRAGGMVKEPKSFTMDLMEEMLAGDGLPTNLLIDALFNVAPLRSLSRPITTMLPGLKGFAAALVRHGEVVRKALCQEDFRIRTAVLGLFDELNVPVEPFVEELVEAAVSKSKAVREKAGEILFPCMSAARPFLEKAAAAKAPETRVSAIRLLAKFFRADAVDFFKTRLAEEKTKSVIEMLTLSLGPSESATAAPLPPLTPIELQVPLPDKLKAEWLAAFVPITAALAGIQENHPRHWFKVANPISEAIIERSFGLLQTPGELPPLLRVLSALAGNAANDALIGFWAHPELKPIHLARFVALIGEFQIRKEVGCSARFGQWFRPCIDVFRATHEPGGLREWAAVFNQAGVELEFAGRQQILHWSFNRQFPWSDGEIWPYWSEHLDLLMSYLNGTNEESWRESVKLNVYGVLATFPEPPAVAVQHLWEMALGGPKDERPLAQRALERAPDRAERLIGALDGGSAERRIAAAQWLGRMRETRAVEPLVQALKKEKSEQTKGALIAVLEVLGVSAERFLDREALSREAIKEMNVPEALQWFPFEFLPVVHWAGRGEPVPVEIVRWWILQQFKLKNPAPGALLRRYCAHIDGREALGQWILAAWIGADTAPISRAEAEPIAQSQAYVMACLAQLRQATPGLPPAPVKSFEQHYFEALPKALLTPKGSAIHSKGILAVAGACLGAGAAAAVQAYLKQWYGMRPAQCRALLQMLAWVDQPSAIQVLLATGTRFRTKSIREEAETLVRELADRKGWTLEELGDRTIPTAGLDEEGVLELDFGPRTFFARLNGKLEFQICDDAGKALNALPEPRKDDDEEKAAKAKKSLATARKELKGIVTLQRQRLYAAMCTEQTWSFEDWGLYLNQHPVVRHFTQRLVWAIRREGAPALFCRPLADGSLTDASDQTVEHRPTDLIQIAHRCHATEEIANAWRSHLADYNVEPLLEQFSPRFFNLTPQQRNEVGVRDFEGFMVDAFKLRARAIKLGYLRGETQDGGWFDEYEKQFPGLGIQASIEFSGNSLPEENRAVALMSLSFSKGGARGGCGTLLGDIPQVMLSECWNDLRLIAGEGSGFDPDWRSKVNH